MMGSRSRHNNGTRPRLLIRTVAVFDSRADRNPAERKGKRDAFAAGSAAAAAETTVEKKTATRKPRAPRKKAVVPNFVIQNSAEDGVSYADVVKKVQAAVTAADVTSLDIYVKAEEGKAYYVVNGEAAGAVDLF